MKILLLGSGGREHTFAWKISQSSLCEKLYIAPGNAGTAQHGTNVDLNPVNFKEVGIFCLDRQIDMLVVGPEAPLVEGIADFFAKNNGLQHIKVVGPSKEAAQLEGSKDFAKSFMQKYAIPTAKYQSFTADQLEEGIAFIDRMSPPIVLKADGLAAGKGVLIIPDRESAKKELEVMLKGKFGAASKTVVIEEFLEGIEFSVFVLTDGQHYKILPVAKDYKRIGEGDTGLNTGGMGAVSPVPFVDEALLHKVEQEVIQPTINGLEDQHMNYKGFIFFGFMYAHGMPYLLEYNCRMGDPETQVVFPRLNNDLVVLFNSLFDSSLSMHTIEEDPQTATAIVLVSGGYPQAYEKGKVISGEEQVEDSIVFHAGTKQQNDQTVTNGGRVMAVVSLGNSIQEALKTSNKNADLIDFEGKYFRKDIGLDLLEGRKIGK